MNLNINALLSVPEIKFKEFETRVCPGNNGGFGSQTMVEHMKKYFAWLREKGDTITIIDKMGTLLAVDEMYDLVTKKKVFAVLRTVIAYKENPIPYR